MIDHLLNFAGLLKSKIERIRLNRRNENLRNSGMNIGKHVFMPLSTWIDTSHCFLISIGDHCRFGPDCVILAHDATMNEFLDAGKIGRVLIHNSCSIGMRTYILPGVEIGPRVIVGAGSVITKNIPPDSVVSGNPAQVVANIDYYLKYHKLMMKKVGLFPYEKYCKDPLDPKLQNEILEKIGSGIGYITGGYTTMRKRGEL